MSREDARKPPRRNRPEVADELTAQQAIAIAALMRGETHEDAAREAGVSARTLYRWRAEDAAFAAEFKRRTDAITDHVQRQLKALSTKALRTLDKVMSDTDDEGTPVNPAPARVAAAKEILSRVAPEQTETTIRAPDLVDAFKAGIANADDDAIAKLAAALAKE